MTSSFLTGSIRKRFPIVIALSLTLIFLLLGLTHLDLNDDSFITSLEKRWIDAKFRLRGPQVPGNETIIVGIGEKTLDKLGSVRTFSRNNWAQLVDRIAEGRPKVIGFDVLFNERDTSNPENDKVFAEAVRNAGNVVLGVYIELKAEVGQRREATPMDADFENTVVEKQVFPAEFRGKLLSSIQGDNLKGLKLPELTQAAASFGVVNFHPDKEGRLRHEPQFIEYGGRLYPSLDIQILRKYLGAPSPIIEASDGRIEQISVGDKVIPTDEYGRYTVNFAGRGCHAGNDCLFPTIEMIDLIDGAVSPEILRDKIVLVGSTAIGLGDVTATPFDEWLPGVELHANVLDNFLHERHLYRNAASRTIDLALILIFGIVPGLYLPRLNASRSVIYSILLLAAFAGFNYWAFVSLHWVQSFMIPGLELVLVSSSLISYNYLTEEREKKRTKQTFQYYLDQNVIEQVMNQPEMPRLGGEKREMTVLFSDIRGFTNFSEKMAPTEVVQFLNQYFEKMTGLIFDYKGTLDKLIGDAVMCFWGHPLESEDHAVRSTICALEMIQAVEDLRPVLTLPGGARFEIGIGVSTGPMVVGNMGSPNRFSYTVMGDNVNLGSRLESLNKYYGTKVLISDATYEACKNVIYCRELDTIQVKGKSRPVTIYEPMGLRLPYSERRSGDDRREEVTLWKRLKAVCLTARHGERREDERRLGSERLTITPAQEEIGMMYELALALYRKGDFNEAGMAFDHVLSLSPGDGPSRLMKDRIDKYRTEYAGDESGFDFVYRFYEK